MDAYMRDLCQKYLRVDQTDWILDKEVLSNDKNWVESFKKQFKWGLKADYSAF